MDTLPALVAFSFVTSVTPGPNNVLLWASGAEFGLRRTARHILGTAVGIGVMALGAAAGLAALIAAIPALGVAMKLGGSAYLLLLAFRLAGMGDLTRSDLARPLDLRGAAAFQAINPKAWVFALGAVTTFRPTGLSGPAGSVLVAVTMMSVTLSSATIWAAAGGAISGLLTNEGRRRALGLVLAALVVATVASVWL